MIFQRHDLVFAEWKQIDTSNIQNDSFRKLLHDNLLPGIVRREETDNSQGNNYYTQDEKVFVGFVYPYTIEGRRLRFASSVFGNKILKLITPYEVPNYSYEPRTPALSALALIKDHFEIGVWGSTSLEIVTGMHYTHDMSDLDLLVKNYSHEELVKLLSLCKKIESEMEIKIDVEVNLKSGYGINLKEYASENDTLLGKGLRDVILIDRMGIEACL